MVAYITSWCMLSNISDYFPRGVIVCLGGAVTPLKKQKIRVCILLQLKCVYKPPKMINRYDDNQKSSADFIIELAASAASGDSLQNHVYVRFMFLFVII
jgi:hypothetical protein